MLYRHGHLMLFDDDEQLEVRHVIALAHHDVSVYNGGDRIPEGELWIKRNAICLSRKTDAGEVTADGTVSKPFFLFSENCSDKEDFYFALLRNQERHPHSNDNPPIPLQYDVKVRASLNPNFGSSFFFFFFWTLSLTFLTLSQHVIELVQRLHSSEEHLQTRWINALMGRLFLALYKTSGVEDFIRAKITKKISRAKTPSFLSGITLRKVDMGEGAPYLTNPRLKDLTVDGECVVEADVKYTGNFRIEVATTARIELGSRFKAREVNLVLAVVLKKLEGHALVRIKAPPSNRIWMSFQTMPKLEMTIEPIVSSRQITYTLILRQIENRIKEVFAETLVYPNWDDSPFSHTDDKKWRGGIWADDDRAPEAPDLESSAAKDGDVDQLRDLEESVETSEVQMDPVERSMSVPAVEASAPSTLFARKAAKSALNLKNSKATGSSSSFDARTSKERPRSMRSGSFSAAFPVVSTDTMNVDAYRNAKATEQSDAASGLAALSARSQNSSPVTTPVASPSRAHNFAEKTGSTSSASSAHSKLSEKSSMNDRTPQPSVNIPTIVAESSTMNTSPVAESPINNTRSLESLIPETTKSSETIKSLGHESRQETSSSSSSSGKSNDADKSGAPEKRLTLQAVTSAAATAKRWGLNALQRHSDSLVANRERADSNNGRPDTSMPMGRGRPLPPPGMPLPPPDRKTKTAPIPVPKRKPVATPPSLPLNKAGKSTEALIETERADRGAPPPLPRRRPEGLDLGHRNGSDDSDGMLVVPAPLVDSEPTTPLENKNKRNNYMQPQVEDEDDEDLPAGGFSSFKSNDGRKAMPEDDDSAKELDIGDVGARPRLPQRRAGRGVRSPLPEDEDFGMSESLPGWMKAQEEESRKRSMWVDDDGGYP